MPTNRKYTLLAKENHFNTRNLFEFSYEQILVSKKTNAQNPNPISYDQDPRHYIV